METPPPDLRGTPGRSRADMARGDSHPVFPVPGVMAPAAGEPTRSFAAKAGELKHSGIALPEGAPAWAARAYGEAAFQAALKEILSSAPTRPSGCGRLRRLWAPPQAGLDGTRTGA